MPDISNGEKTYLCVRSHGLKANAVMNLLLEFSMMLFCFEPARAGGRCWTGRGGLLWLRLECGSLWFFCCLPWERNLRGKLELRESSGNGGTESQPPPQLRQSPLVKHTSASSSCSLTDTAGKAGLSRAPLVHSKWIHIVLAIWSSSERQDFSSEK